jgi:predicted amidohydrolase
MKIILSTIILIVITWVIWAYLGYNPKLPEIQSEISLLEDIFPLHSDSTKGNVVGIQPYMLESDYLSQQQFLSKLESYFKAAQEAGFLRENTIVLLPEYLGTWLVISGEKKSVGNTGSLTWAMAQMILSHPFQFIKNFRISTQETDRIAAGLFRMKAGVMAEAYQITFSSLAEKYKIYIAAGSINLPDPQITKGRIQVNPNNPIYNTSFVFGPDGIPLPLSIRKAYPIESEKPFIAASSSTEIPKFKLPMGNIGVLVCADSWYPDAYEAIRGVDLVLVNSYCAIDGAMDVPWAGYNGSFAPEDVDLSDIGQLSEKQAWEKYALPGRIGLSGAKNGVNVFLRGELWDLGTDGQPFFIRDGQLLQIQPAEKGGIWNMDF